MSPPLTFVLLMPPPRRLAFALVYLCALGALSGAPAASEWKDNKGATFRAEAVEALGPLLMFRTSALASRFLPMRIFSPEDCVRFHQAIASRLPRAEHCSRPIHSAS